MKKEDNKIKVLKSEVLFSNKCIHDNIRNNYLCQLKKRVSAKYEIAIKDILPTKRGFFGETWKIVTENNKYFIKLIFWSYHQKRFLDSLDILTYMITQGITFIPTIIKTKDGNNFFSFQNGYGAIFDYIEGDNNEIYPMELLIEKLLQLYKLDVSSSNFLSETFNCDLINIYNELACSNNLSNILQKKLIQKNLMISRYARRLEFFSNICSHDLSGLHLTHGDAGGNCILNGNNLMIVDWDSAQIAPIERDMWIYFDNATTIHYINSQLMQTGLNYQLKTERICYYCYYFFFYYLTEYLKAIIHTDDKEKKLKIEKETCEYLSENWIYERLKLADRIR